MNFAKCLNFDIVIVVLYAGQCGLVAEDISTHAGSLDSIPGEGIEMVVCLHYQIGQAYEWVYR